MLHRPQSCQFLISYLTILNDVITIEYIGLQLNYFEAKKMAFFIQSLSQLYVKSWLSPQPLLILQDSFQQSTPSHFNAILQNLVKNKIKQNKFQVTHDPISKNIIIRFIRIRNYKHINIFIKLSINYQTCLLQLGAKIMSKSLAFAKLDGLSRRKLQAKNTYTRESKETESKISVNMDTGIIQLDFPFYHVGKNLTNSVELTLNLLTKLYTLNMQQLDRKLQFLILIMDEQYGYTQSEAKASEEKNKVNQIYRFSGLLNIYLNLTSETLNQQQDLIHNLHKQAQSYRRLQATRVQLGKDFKNIALYSTSTIESFKRTASEQQPLNFIQRLYFQKRLQLPNNKKCPNPNENFFVLNYIKLNKKIPEGNLRKIQKGGFTTIYLTQVECWYVGSYCAGQKEMLEIQSNTLKQSPPLRKKIIIKREDKSSLKCGKSRVAHQINILKNIKCGLSLFLPKFYLLAEKEDTYANDLLVDYINTPNLNQFIMKNSHILSMNTKLYIILMIGQGLRYLKQYKIAHLDIKPTNIMTYHKLTFKLIDFGQSYHPSIKNHQPGVSSPYSAPQNYRFKESYNHKNDVYSLGIIMYELLIGKYPFYFYDQVLKEKVFFYGTYLNRWFELPEDMLVYGEPVISPILFHIMRKCLHADPEHRPELEWIVIILRECLDYFK